ncbi:MAG: translation initiation factor IF-2 [Chloroflexi bacterium]|nr:translation initiation factor IF-2 [Chloroflexota bacterium]
MPRPLPNRGRPASRPGQTRGGRAGRLEAFQRQAERGGENGSSKPAQIGPIELPSVVSAGELAARLNVTPPQVIKALFTNGVIATINQSLDFDTAAVVAADLGFEVREQGTPEAQPAAGDADGASAGAQAVAAAEAVLEEAEDEALLVPRPPVITIMGHVDHGKTSLLDAIRSTRVASGEAGGITQHIGAYQVEVNGRKVTFLDTPGHEAFTAMRARGAQATDIAVVVVAADDGVMPQTREAIDHARAAKVPMVVAINKIDRPNAQPERVKQELADFGVVVTEYGGTIEAVPVSATTREGLDSLLETLLLVSEAEVDPKANPTRAARGVVIEARMDKFRGAVATLLVQRGTLRVGDVVVAGTAFGKVKALFDDHGQRVKEAGPSFPVEVLGLTGVPSAGDRFTVAADERIARLQVESTQRAGQRDGETDNSAEAVFARVRSAAAKELNLIVKADVQGSLEPVVNSLERLGGEGQAKPKVIHAGMGNINVTDVNLAVASGALIVSFNVKVEPDAKRAAERTGVAIREYSVIYTLIEEIEALLLGSAEPKFEEVIHGHVEVRATFKAGKRTIAGCYVTDGIVHRKDRARLMRGGAQVWDGGLDSLKRFKDDVAEVREGFECGILLEGNDDLQVGDILEIYSSERV